MTRTRLREEVSGLELAKVLVTLDAGGGDLMEGRRGEQRGDVCEIVSGIVYFV